MKSISRRMAGMAGVIGVALFCHMAGAADSQPYPNKPVRLIVPFGPGGANDITGRILGSELTQRLGTPVVVENRVGASGVIGTDAVAKARPDGYTLGVGNGSALVMQGLANKLPYTTRDFTYIGPVAKVEMVLVASREFAPNRLEQVVDYARSNPGKTTYASAGSADRSGVTYLTLQFLAQSRGVEFLPVPYAGDTAMMNAIISGQVNIGIVTVASSVAQIKAGRLKPVAVGASTRSASLPDVPTISESGLPGFESSAFSVLIGPAELPGPITSRLNAALNDTLRTPAVQDRFHSLGLTPRGGTGKEAEDYVAREVKVWSCVNNVVNGKGAAANACF